jgi:lysine-specific demethylase 8
MIETGSQTATSKFHELDPANGRAIERISWSSNRRDWPALLDRREPAILTDYVAESWGAFQRWTFPYLGERVGTNTANPVVLGDRAITNLDYMPTTTRKLAFSESLERLEEQSKRPARAGDVYLTQGGILSDPTSPFHVLFEDIDVPPLPLELRSVNMWIGSGGNNSYLHFDPRYNIMGVLRGLKRFVLVDPKYTRNVYPIFSPDPLGSALDVTRLDFDRFPRARNLQYLEGDVRAGDAIYLPPAWWHFVRSEELNLAVNCWWLPRASDWVRLAPMRGLLVHQGHRMAYYDVRERIGRLAARVRDRAGPR